MDSYISAIGIANPPHRIKQSQIAEFMIKAHDFKQVQEKTRLEALYRATGIEYRYSVLEDYGLETGFKFYPNSPDLEPFPRTEDRSLLYRAEALELSQNAIKNCLNKVPDFEVDNVSHLITVSCTGMYAPGLDIDLVKELGLSTAIKRTAVNFMGCYAAFNAIKLADSIVKADEKAHVLVVCVELCSIHFQKNPSEDNLLANSLFGDGAAAMLVSNQPQSQISIQPQAFHNDLLFGGENEMAWAIGDFGFEMKLSAYVPDIIQKGIATLLEQLFAKTGKTDETVDYYAVHPGGKKILKVIEEEIGISKERNSYAHEVLRQYGNMSSPTILFVLEKIMEVLTIEDNHKEILALAFGPGLTLESASFKIINRA
ncbi:MAG: type III polyketide synthase [Bacteroidota bacterium]